MTIRESLERRPASEAAGGAWLSAVLSVAVFLIVVALGKSYDSAHPLHRKPADPARSALSGPAIAETSAPAASTPSLTENPPDAQPDVPAAAQPKRAGKALHRRAARVRASRGHSVVTHSRTPAPLIKQAQQ